MRPRGVVVDTEAFPQGDGVQKTEARRAWKGTGEARPMRSGLKSANASGASEFLGYETEKAEGVITAMVAGGKQVTSLKPGTRRHDRHSTRRPFMRESGGQTGDHGVIRTAGGGVFSVTGTEKRAGRRDHSHGAS